MNSKHNDTCIAVGQLTSTSDKCKNLNVVRSLAKKAAFEHGAKMLFLPEATDYITSSPIEMLNMAETLWGPTVGTYKEIAKNNNLWISVGVHEKVQQKMHNDKVYNTQLVLNNDGDIVGSYRKLHLFDAHVPGLKDSMKESSTITPGSDIIAPISTPIGKLGLMICYDLRFPDMSTLLREMGAEVLTYPSAFTCKTGEAHWKPMLCARAIETQCYVVAAAQIGQHCPGRPASYGHALIVDPWGHVIAECPPYNEVNGKDCNEPVVLTAHIKLGQLEAMRASMPVLQHRRPEVYAKARVLPTADTTADDCDMMFADKKIPASTIFYRTPLSFAFTNIRCVVPGHVLVCSRRQVDKVTKLQDHELADLFSAAVRIQRAMERLHNVESSTLVVQDGPDAGRTVPHVHVHILPRRPGDFEENDEVYSALAKHDKQNTAFPLRDIDDMIAEAQAIQAAMDN